MLQLNMKLPPAARAIALLNLPGNPIAFERSRPPLRHLLDASSITGELFFFKKRLFCVWSDLAGAQILAQFHLLTPKLARLTPVQARSAKSAKISSPIERITAGSSKVVTFLLKYDLFWRVLRKRV
jgi:hypothetical protein